MVSFLERYYGSEADMRGNPGFQYGWLLVIPVVGIAAIIAAVVIRRRRRGGGEGGEGGEGAFCPCMRGGGGGGEGGIGEMVGGGEKFVRLDGSG